MKLPKETHDLLEAYFGGDTSYEVIQAMEDWLREDPGNARILAEYGLLDRLISAEQKKQDASAIFASLLDDEKASRNDAAVINPKDTAAALALAELAKLHEDGLGEPAHLQPDPPFSPYPTTTKSTKLKTRLIVGGALAAMIAISGAVVLVVSIIMQPSVTPIVQEDKDSTFVVATVTALRGAEWTDDADNPLIIEANQPLEPGSTLRLTEGVAEITTERGAVAVIEAPAFIEFIDNDNAILLHAGKLFGICETDLSKGFLVRTPILDVVDLGTRFGVDASDSDATEVHVFDGEVEVSRPSPETSGQFERQRLGQEQALRAEANQERWVPIETELSRFTDDQKVHPLAGTGASIHRGARSDAEWRLIAVDNQLLDSPVPLSISQPVGASNETPNQPGIARWLRVNNPKQYQGEKDAVYTIQHTLVLPRHIDLENAVLRIDFHADDRLVGMQFNGQPYPGWELVEHSKNGKGSATIPLNKTSLQHGPNTINIDVRNIAKTDLYLNLAWLIEQDTEPKTTN